MRERNCIGSFNECCSRGTRNRRLGKCKRSCCHSVVLLNVNHLKAEDIIGRQFGLHSGCTSVRFKIDSFFCNLVFLSGMDNDLMRIAMHPSKKVTSKSVVQQLVSFKATPTALVRMSHLVHVLV